jgi:putative transposase
LVRYRRNWLAGGTFFFTVALVNRRSELLTGSIDVLRAAMRTVRVERPFEIDAMVVLPEHVHAVWTLPAGDADYAHRWRRIKSVFTRGVLRQGAAFRRRDESGVALWQRRYWEHTIRDDADFARHVDYIHYNPVRHGYVVHALDWPFSSLHRFVRDGVLADGWGEGAAADEGEFGEPRA